MIDDLLAARARTHGDFEQVAAVAQGFKALMHGAPNWPRLSSARREALEQHAAKLARFLCGDPDHADHLDDSIGYLTLMTRGVSLQGNAPESPHSPHASTT